MFSQFGVFPRSLGQGISVVYLRQKTRSDHVSGNALAARNNKDQGQGNGSQSFCKVLRIEGRGVGRGLCKQAIKVPPIETLMQGCLKKSRKSNYRLQATAKPSNPGYRFEFPNISFFFWRYTYPWKHGHAFATFTFPQKCDDELKLIIRLVFQSYNFLSFCDSK